MALKHLSLEQIDEGQLQRLIDGQSAETRDIEYKRESYGNADKDHGEYLADISSFANASGGDLIIGMNAKAGVPVAFAPLQLDADAEILRLESIARSGLQPRIFGYEARTVPVAAAFEAFKSVEVAVRTKAGFTTTDFGAPLMKKAFDPNSGPLRDKAAPPARQKARCDLFTGAFGEIRNPKGHNDPTITDALVAAEELMAAGILRRIVDNA